jgi:hypothetical protein
LQNRRDPPYDYPPGPISEIDGEEAMPDFNRDALKRSLQEQGAARINRAQSRRSVDPAAAANAKQKSEESTRAFEAAAAEAGIDARKLFVALARTRKQTQEAGNGRQPRTAASSSAQPTTATATSGRFRSLQQLAGRAIPLDQPSSLTFLNEPLFFTQYGTVASLESFSIAPNNTFFRAAPTGRNLGDYAKYAFWYLWNNDSDTAMLTTVSTALELNGDVWSRASSIGAVNCYHAAITTEISGELNLGTLDNPFMESRTPLFVDFQVQSHIWNFPPGVNYGEFSVDHQDHGMSIDGFLVQPNSTLVISVWTDFIFYLDFNDDEDTFSEANFADDGGSVICPGVVVLTSPVIIQ